MDIIKIIVYYGKELTDLIRNLCQTKFNDQLGLFYINSHNWGCFLRSFQEKKRNQIPSLYYYMLMFLYNQRANARNVSFFTLYDG